MKIKIRILKSDFILMLHKILDNCVTIFISFLKNNKNKCKTFIIYVFVNYYMIESIIVFI